MDSRAADGQTPAHVDHRPRHRPVGEIFLVFLRLGLTSFGGPIAHLGYFRDEIVNRRKWLDDYTYADLKALCQFTPGAASSKVGIGIGLSMGGLPGAIASWLAFTLPSALALILFAYGVTTYSEVLDSGFLHGLKVVAVAVLQSEVVRPGWVTNDTFLAGHGAAQAVPGPLFTFAGYLGAVMTPQPNGWLGALICVIGIFLPSFLLTVGALPFWEDLRRMRAVRSALVGVNAAVVGLLLAALYNPVWTSAIKSPADFGLAITAFGLLAPWKVPPWLVVLLTAVGSWAIGSLPTTLS